MSELKVDVKSETEADDSSETNAVDPPEVKAKVPAKTGFSFRRCCSCFFPNYRVLEAIGSLQTTLETLVATNQTTMNALQTSLERLVISI